MRTLVSPLALRTPRGRLIYWATLSLTVTGFTAAFVFPLYWMVSGALKSPDELAQIPPSFFPTSFDLGVYADAWEQLQLGVFLKNTVMYAGGAWLFTLAIDVTAAYALSKLRPMFGKVVLGAMLATLMIPPMVLLLPTYLTAKDLPILHLDLLNTPWAIWLPAAANGFFVFLLKRFFDSIPRELLEAAEIDGASAWARFRRVTVPLISPTILLTMILTIVGSLQVFAQIAVLTQGGPGTSTTVLVYYLYQQAFQFHHFGYGATLSLLLFGIVLVLTVLQWRMRRRWVFHES